MESYKDFLSTKAIKSNASGFTVDKSTLNPHLYEWQRDIVAWALRKGKACLFEDCGLGKTLQQLSFADEVSKKTGMPVLIVSPLAVAVQTVREAEKFGMSAKLCNDQSDVINGICVTNYEKLHKFDADEFFGVVLDESSILKNHDGKTRKTTQSTITTIKYPTIS